MNPANASSILAERLRRPTALVTIDVQRDFVEPDGGFAKLGYDIKPLRAVLPNRRLQVECGTRIVVQTGCKKHGAVSFGFKAGSRGLREFTGRLIKTLLGNGCQVKDYGPSGTPAQRRPGLHRKRDLPVSSLMFGSAEVKLGAVGSLSSATALRSFGSWTNTHRMTR